MSYTYTYSYDTAPYQSAGFSGRGGVPRLEPSLMMPGRGGGMSTTADSYSHSHNGYLNQFTHSQYHVSTPTGSSEWGSGSYPNSPSYGPSEFYGQSFGRNGSFSQHVHGSGDGTPTVVVGAQKTLQEGKKYRHDPYASSEAGTPPVSPLTLTPASMSRGMTGQYEHGFAALPGPAAGPVYDPNFSDIPVGVSAHPSNAIGMGLSSTVEDQFASMIGSIPSAACTARGRNILLNVIRLQHLDKIQIIFDELCANMSSVILDGQGCHVLRFLMDYLQPSHVDQLMRTFTPDLLFLVATHSQHSRRVLQCLVEQHKTVALDPMISILCANRLSIEIARTQQGCIAIMRMLENVLPAQKERLFRSLAPAIPDLSIDQFGNYAIQTAIQQIDPVLLSATFQDVLYGQFIRISCNKFGSNVMEKLISSACPELLTVLLNQLVFTESTVQKLVQDAFGNFVLQALVEAAANTPDGRRVCDAIRPLLHSSPYGQKIEAKLRSKRLLSGFNDVNIRGGNNSCASSHSSDSR